LACLTHGPDFRTYGLTEGNGCRTLTFHLSLGLFIYFVAVCAFDNIVGVTLPAAPPTLPASSCNVTCTNSPRELCGGTGAVQLYHFENLTPVLRALAGPSLTGSAVIAVILGVTAANAATVGPVSIWL
jgi:hypothetical protein